jgi:hypothetical protein
MTGGIKKKNMKKIMLMLVSVVVLFSCVSSPKKPWWIEKRLNKPEVLEGLGYAVGLKDKKALRDTAINDAIQKLILSSSIEVSGYIETRLFAQRDLGIPKSSPTGGELLDNVNKSIYNTVLERKYFEEFYDPKTGEYWVYVWIPQSTVSKISAQQTLQTLEKAVTASEKMKSVREDLEKDLENYQKKEQEDLEKIKSSMPTEK